MYKKLIIKLLDYSVRFYLTSNYHKIGKSKIYFRERSENWLTTTLKSLWKWDIFETYSVKRLAVAVFGLNQVETKNVDKFLAVKWKKKFHRVSRKKVKIEKISKFFWPFKIPKNTFKDFFCTVHFFYLGLYFQNISIFWL